MRKGAQPSALKSRGGWRRLRGALAYSVAGFAAALRHEASFRQELALGVPMLLVTPWLAPSRTAGVVMAASVVAVWVVELLNSALEALADALSSEIHPLLGRAKDLGSAAVMLSMVFAGVVWGVCLWP
jgi:diacylglycerol kinase (ATP)